jgi:polysaccharide export outer membrane protein
MVVLAQLSIASRTRAQAPVEPVPPQGSSPTVETQQQTNDRIRALSAAAHIVPHDYVVGTGDLISMQVFDVPELSRDLRVSETGTIGIPLVPVRIHVAGLSELQVEQKIAEVLEANGLVTHADVSIAVRERKSKPITIVGAVAHPMVYEAVRQVTLVEVLAEAGGIANDAGDNVIVTRGQNASMDPSEPPPLGEEETPPASSPAPSPQSSNPPVSASAPDSSAHGDLLNQKPAATTPAPAAENPQNGSDASATTAPATNTITVNLNQILETGNMQDNIVLMPGDVVTVPHAGIVYVLGSVNRPGGFVVSNDRRQLSTLKVLALAGGFTRTAKSSSAVIVRKDSSGQQIQVPVDLKKIQNRETEDVKLLPSDILYVPNSAFKSALFRTGELALGITTGILIYRAF